MGVQPKFPPRAAGQVLLIAVIGGMLHAAASVPGLLWSQAAFRFAELGAPLLGEAILAAAGIAILCLPLLRFSRSAPVALPAAIGLATSLIGAALVLSPPRMPAPLPAPSAAPRTVVLVTLDTFRRDHMSAMPGALAADLTPHLDALAAESTLFTDAYTVAPLTLPAHTTLLTGVAPQHHGVLRNGLSVPEELQGIPAELAREGYITGGFTSSLVLHASHGLARWFHTYRNTPASMDLSRAFLLVGPIQRRWLGDNTKLGKSSGAVAVDQAKAWLDALPRDRSVFLWVHFYDAHTPYVTHDANPGATTWPGLPSPCDWSAHPTAARQPIENPLIPLNRVLPPTEACAGRPWTSLQERIQSYTDEIRFLDRQLGRLLDGLDDAGRGDAKILVVADHGESLVEHQYFSSHQHDLYDPVMRVPLLVRDPACADCSGRRVADPVSTLRVGATLRALAGLPADPDIAGPSLLEPEADGVQVAIGPAPLRRLSKRDRPLQAVARQGTRKVLVDDRGHIERYTLDRDPLETRPLLLPHEQEALQASIDEKLAPKKFRRNARDPLRHIMQGGLGAPQPGLNEVLLQPGVLGERITPEESTPFEVVEARARQALEAARSGTTPSEEGVDDSVRESLEALGYLQ